MAAGRASLNQFIARVSGLYGLPEARQTGYLSALPEADGARLGSLLFSRVPEPDR
jgi:hypothetical protein